VTTTADRIAATADPQDLAERRRAARALLKRPLLASGSTDPDDLRLVRRHQSELIRLFADGLGYRLQVDPTSARLFKTGLGTDSTRPLRRRSGASFTPRAYALLCLTIAALTRARTQLLVDELVAQVRAAAVDAGLDIDLDAIGDRRALHAAIVVLVDLGVLRERDGDLEHWADQRTQSLLDVRRDLLSLLVAAPLTAASSAADLLTLAALPSAVGGARIATRRALLERPLLTTDDLTPEHAEWWRRNRNRERDWYDTHFGLELELRAEGAAVIDPDDDLSDERFPGTDKTRQLALLVLEAVADEVQRSAPAGAGTPWRELSLTTVERCAQDVHARWRDRLRRDQREDPDRALREALSVLARFGLIRREDGAVLVHAAATRYAPRVALLAQSATGETSLFDDLTDGED
jgi:uncharacterized protein (TIGR02678 family)